MKALLGKQDPPEKDGGGRDRWRPPERQEDILKTFGG